MDVRPRAGLKTQWIGFEIFHTQRESESLVGFSPRAWLQKQWNRVLSGPYPFVPPLPPFQLNQSATILGSTIVRSIAEKWNRKAAEKRKVSYFIFHANSEKDLQLQSRSLILLHVALDRVCHLLLFGGEELRSKFCSVGLAEVVLRNPVPSGGIPHIGTLIFSFHLIFSPAGLHCDTTFGITPSPLPPANEVAALATDVNVTLLFPSVTTTKLVQQTFERR